MNLETSKHRLTAGSCSLTPPSASGAAIRLALILALAVVIFTSTSTKAGISVSGNVLTNTYWDDNYTVFSLVVGETEGAATLTVDGGSLLDGIALGYRNPYINAFILGDGVGSSQNHATVTGVGIRNGNLAPSLVACGGIVGSWGSSNSLTISGGGGLSGGLSIGTQQNSSYNEVIVTDPGSFVTGAVSIGVGEGTLSNRCTFQHGAVISSPPGTGLFNWGSGTTVTIQDSGTAWFAGGLGIGGSNSLVAILNGAQMLISNPGGLCSVSGWNNTLQVAGNGSLVKIDGGLFSLGGNGARLVITSGGLLVASAMDRSSSADSAIVIDHGALVVSNGSGGGMLRVSGSLTNSGIVAADQIVCAPDVNNDPLGSIYFVAGTIMTKGLSYSNGTPFTVGDGTSSANYILQGGTHAFGNGLVVSSNGAVSGCGTIIGSVTNYGLMILTNGCDITFSGPVMNFGTILALNANVNFQSTFVNNGTFFNNTARVTGLAFSGNDVLVQFSTVSSSLHDVQGRLDLTAGDWISLTNGLVGTGGSMTISDAGGATNGHRFYRVLLHY